MLNDSHCHFFSTQFFNTLSRQRGRGDTVAALCQELQWDDPGTPETLADRWVKELDANDVTRTALIASVPGDEASVASAVARYPARFVGFFRGRIDHEEADEASRVSSHCRGHRRFVAGNAGDESRSRHAGTYRVNGAADVGAG